MYIFFGMYLCLNIYIRIYTCTSRTSAESEVITSCSNPSPSVVSRPLSSMSGSAPGSPRSVTNARPRAASSSKSVRAPEASPDKTALRSRSYRRGGEPTC